MTLAGMAYCVGSLLMTREFFTLQCGAKKVYTAENLTQAFAEVVPTSTVLSAMKIQNATAYDIQNTVVIPVEAILTFVPGWKTAAN